MSEATARGNALLQEAAKTSVEEIGRTLRDLGLTGYAADTLCALVRLPEATAGDLVAKTGIPDSKIYYALNELVEKGLVEVQAGKPKTYRAVPVEQSRTRLQALLESKYDRERDAISRAASLLEPIQAGAKSPASDLAYIVKGSGNVVARARSMIASARREVLLLSSEEDVIGLLKEDLERAARKGRELRLAVPDIDLGNTLERKADVRRIACACTILVVDGQQMLTFGGSPETIVYGITSTDETLVRLSLDYWDSPACSVEKC